MHQRRQGGFMRIAHHQRNARQGGNLLGSPLRVTTSHHDTSFGVFPMNPSHGLSQVRIGIGGHGAGVEDHQIRAEGRFGWRHPGGQQLGFECRAVGLRGSATEILHVKPGHVSSVRRTRVPTKAARSV